MEKIGNNSLLGGSDLDCKYCGTQLPDVAKFCFICGKVVEGDSVPEKKNEEENNIGMNEIDDSVEEVYNVDSKVAESIEYEPLEVEHEIEEFKEEYEADESKEENFHDSSKDDDEEGHEEEKGGYSIMVNPDYVPPEPEEEIVLFAEHIDYQSIYREKADRIEKIVVKIGTVACIIAVVAVVGFLGFKFMSSKKFDKTIQEARSEYNAGNYELALSKIEEAKGIYTADEVEIGILQADVYVAQGENDKALSSILETYNNNRDKELYNKYLSVKNSIEETDDNAADDSNDTSDMQDQGELTSAEEGSEEYLKLLGEAEKFLETGDFDSAINSCNEAVKVDATIESVYVVYAQACDGKKDYKKAAAILEVGVDKLNDVGKSVSADYSNMLKKYQETAATLEEYEKFYVKLYDVAKAFYSTTDISGLIKCVLDDEFKSVIANSQVTYYTQQSGFVSEISDGEGMAVYNNGYLYYGSFKDGKRSGSGIFAAVAKDDEGKIKYNYYKGDWSGDLPNGKGTIFYAQEYGTPDIAVSITTGTFKNGYENGVMTRSKTVAGKKWGKMEYKVKDGVPQPLKDGKGNVVKNKDNLPVLGYHYFNNKPTYVITIVEGSLFGVEGLGLNLTQ